MATTTFTQEQIVKKFVYLDLPEEGYNNQDFMRCLMRHYAMYLLPVNYLIMNRKLKKVRKK